MRVFVALFCCFLLGACAPRYVQDYDLFPPASAQGKQCVTECTVVKESCEKECYQDALQCERMNNFYDGYGPGIGLSYGYGLRRDYWDRNFGSAFPSSTSCGTAGCVQACRASQLQCHQNCGGTVVPRAPTCVANCPK